MQKAIYQLAIEEVTQRLEAFAEGRPFFSRENYSIHMGIDRGVLIDVLRLLRVPARLSENRVVLVTRGEAKFSLDMMEYEAKAPCFALLKDNTLLHIRSMSPDFLCHAIAYGKRSLLDTEKETVVPISDDERVDIEQTMMLIWRFCNKKNLSYAVVLPLLEALFEQYSLLVRTSTLPEDGMASVRKGMIFRQFLSLVSANFAAHRELCFYADALCISVHYLCEAVFAVGGHYPKYYIHQALVSEAKYLLAYTDQSAAVISEVLEFSNPAWFSRFFKRETGLTPGEFRAERWIKIRNFTLRAPRGEGGNKV